VISLGLLGFFKYADFFIGNINNIFSTGISPLYLPLPIGISFYTFQILSYTIDVYRNNTPLQKNLIALSTYITLFPQLIAGPIIRYNTIAQELTDRKHSLALFAEGIHRFVIGLGKKVFIANNVALIWELSKTTQNPSVLLSWLGIIGFSFQIYFDFSGYSDMAIGLGRMLGFRYQENFNFPYISRSITEFWRRWHMSLSQWFRDYLYIPLLNSLAFLVSAILGLYIVFSKFKVGLAFASWEKIWQELKNGWHVFSSIVAINARQSNQNDFSFYCLNFQWEIRLEVRQSSYLLCLSWKKLRHG